ncbi:MAG: nucleotide sugar dehydrogenase [Nitrospiraceae bacterium]|nr:nucleotide sugar dehydrogenase [Nitrospiraceae bacterium]
MGSGPALSVVGLGKLGACSAACFAAKGFQVTGVDINRDFVDAINRGEAPVREPRLQEMINLSQGRLRATRDYEEAMRVSDITFLIVPTPSRTDGHFSDKYLKDALTHLAGALGKLDKEYHIFVITSTVSPGTTEKTLIPLIESVSGRKLNRDFGVSYNPEFIALGSVITDFLNPDMVLIGGSDPSVCETLEGIYSVVCENRPRMAKMSIISAEVTKISLNSFVTMKISFANTLANICRRMPGADIDHITAALGADKRISPHYLKGGLSFGGPCFPRDNRAFAAFAREHGVEARLAMATDEINRTQTDLLVDMIMGHVPEADGSVVGVLGLAYKPNTPVIEESAAIRLIEGLLEKNLEVIAYDPIATDTARAHFGDRILYASSARDCFQSATVCVLTTPCEEFKAIDGSYIAHNPTTIVDCWRLLDGAKFGEGINYLALGRYNNGK